MNPFKKGVVICVKAFYKGFMIANNHSREKELKNENHSIYFIITHDFFHSE